jgi:putative nucleotidyltransferase with HDIG domain
MPVVAAQVLRHVEDAHGSAGELARLIAADQRLSVDVLRLARSARFGRRQPLTSVRQAVVQLGMREVKWLVVTSALGAVNRTATGLDTALWEHALGVATGADLVARELAVGATSFAFLAGLMHDVGHTVLAQNRPEVFQAAYEQACTPGADFIGVERERFGLSHVEAGLEFAAAWELPHAVRDVIRHHHDPEGARGADGVDAHLVACVTFADQACRRLGIGRPPRASEPTTREIEAASAVLGVAASDVDDLVQSVADVVEAERGLLVIGGGR